MEYRLSEHPINVEVEARVICLSHRHIDPKPEQAPAGAVARPGDFDNCAICRRDAHCILAAAESGPLELSRRSLFVVDSRCRIFYRNASARQRLESGAVLYESRGRLRCRAEEAQLALQAGLDKLRFVRVAGAGQTVLPQVGLRLEGERRPTPPLFGTLRVAHSGCRSEGQEESSLVVLSINWPLSEPAVNGEVLETMFDLSPREAAIAATLAAGADLRGIAATLEISLQTVRSHLKSIFAKTDTHRQSELVALLLQVTAD